MSIAFVSKSLGEYQDYAFIQWWFSWRTATAIDCKIISLRKEQDPVYSDFKGLRTDYNLHSKVAFEKTFYRECLFMWTGNTDRVDFTVCSGPYSDNIGSSETIIKNQNLLFKQKGKNRFLKYFIYYLLFIGKC